MGTESKKVAKFLERLPAPPTLGCWVAEGWIPILNEMVDRWEALGLELPRVAQIKEKFGTLRVYLDNETEAQYAIVREAEQKSASTCELCGEPGKLRSDKPWIRTLCDLCTLNRK